MIDPTEYIGYVKSLVIKRYHGSELEDLISVGYYALTKAALSYNDAIGACFKTYLTIRVIGEIKDYLRTIPSKKNRRICKRGISKPFSIIDQESTGDNPDFAASIESKETFYDIDLLKRRVKKKLTPSRKAQIGYEHYLEGKTQSQIAKELGVSASMICLTLKHDYVLNVIKKEIDDTVLL